MCVKAESHSPFKARWHANRDEKKNLHRPKADSFQLWCFDVDMGANNTGQCASWRYYGQQRISFMTDNLIQIDYIDMTRVDPAFNQPNSSFNCHTLGIEFKSEQISNYPILNLTNRLTHYIEFQFILLSNLVIESDHSDSASLCSIPCQVTTMRIHSPIFNPWMMKRKRRKSTMTMIMGMNSSPSTWPTKKAKTGRLNTSRRKSKYLVHVLSCRQTKWDDD